MERPGVDLERFKAKSKCLKTVGWVFGAGAVNQRGGQRSAAARDSMSATIVDAMAAHRFGVDFLGTGEQPLI